MSGIINLDGAQDFDDKRVLLKEDVTEGKIIGVKTVNLKVIEEDKANKQRVEKTVEKIVFTIEVPGGEVTAWYSPRVTKGHGRYSPSSLYLLLEKANLINEISSVLPPIDTVEKLRKYLEQKFVGKKIRFLPKTVESTKDGKRYSKVDKIINIL